MYTTRVKWDGKQNRVLLLRDGSIVADMTLDDWAKLSATTLLTDNLREELTHELNRVAHGLG